MKVKQEDVGYLRTWPLLDLREQVAAWPEAIKTEENCVSGVWLSQCSCVYHNPVAFSDATVEGIPSAPASPPNQIRSSKSGGREQSLA